MTNDLLQRVASKHPRTRTLLIPVVIAFALLSSAGVLCVLHRRDFALNDALNSRGIPILPTDAVVLERGSGGFFAQWLYVVAVMSPEQLAGYDSRLKADADESYALDQAAPQALVITNSSQLHAVNYLERPDLKVVHRATPPGMRSEGWSIEAIRHGSVHLKDLPYSSRYTIYLDRDRCRVFVLWTYS